MFTYLFLGQLLYQVVLRGNEIEQRLERRVVSLQRAFENRYLRDRHLPVATENRERITIINYSRHCFRQTL